MLRKLGKQDAILKCPLTRTYKKLYIVRDLGSNFVTRAAPVPLDAIYLGIEYIITGQDFPSTSFCSLREFVASFEVEFRLCQGSLQRPLESSNIVLISNLPFFCQKWDFRPHFHTSSLKWVSFQKTRDSGWSILERASFSEFIKKFQKVFGRVSRNTASE